ncbi:phage baseplate assembly protein [Gluconacetobacter diazotrophicus]|uniref:Putative bacteriophage related protein n=1 Tax=Gluconacetobacter diazotrophicus (strain ATCC 49037 / DSM 5601 / CCUG 37298 / CIP 103539 / LMG 7603 / PAl5) TaxID=272568 RepID=A9H6K7_GLUDA|nr:phage baseplate assembly protein [Gluconacetobacter diazotrophicus]CAP57510.1 putative bacteriophage related protein [Gluconacetobacter diazotrophicus PA1 5]
MTAPLRRLGQRILMALGIARQLADTDESLTVSRLQVVLPGGEIRSDVPLMQDYGLASRPVPGSDIVVIFQGGDRTRGVAVASGDQRNRPDYLQGGDVALYHPGTGSRIWMKADGSIQIDPAGGKGTISGDWTFSGTITAADVIANGIHLTDHKHSGVQQGNDQTGGPVAT